MGNLTRSAAIVGAYEYPSRQTPGVTSNMIQAECARQALAEAGLSIKDVDGFMSPANMGMDVVFLADYLGLEPKVLDGMNIGGSSFLAHVSRAAAAIAAGQCEVVLITYGATPIQAGRSIGTGGSCSTLHGLPLVLETRRTDFLPLKRVLHVSFVCVSARRATRVRGPCEGRAPGARSRW